MARRGGVSGTPLQLVTLRGRDIQTVSESARRAIGEHALILRVVTHRDGHASSVEVVAADANQVDRFRRRVEAKPLPTAGERATSDRPMVVGLVGPGGAGKTTTLARLATHRHAFAGWKVGFLTLDTFRVGALAELRSYAEITGHPLEVAYDEDEVDEALERLSDRDVVLVDTPGRTAIGGERTARWAPLLRRADPDEVHFVVAASMRLEAATTTLAGLRGVGITHLLVTKLDEVREDRGVADLAVELGLPARWVGEGQELPGGLHPAAGRIVSALAAMADEDRLRVPA